MEEQVTGGGDATAQPGRRSDGLREILAKSSRLMAREGFHGTSMRDLARETGRSLAGLYHYFRSKEDLLFLVHFHGFTTLNEAWERMSQQLGTPDERLFGFIYLHTRYYVDNMDEMRLMNRGTQELEYSRAMTIRTLKDTHTAAARQVIADVQTAIPGADGSAEHMERLTFLLFGMMNWIFGWYSRASHGPVDDLIRDIYSTFRHGIGGGDIDADRIEPLTALARSTFERYGPPSFWETTETRDIEGMV